MVFEKKSRKYTKHQFRINNKVLDNVTEFTYLGITINAGCSFKPTIQTLSEKAMKAIFALNNKFKVSNMPLNVAMKIFDACVIPILIYDSEIWENMFNSDIVKWDSSDTKKVHLQFCKHILGVSRSTMNNMIRAELGRYPLLIDVQTRIIEFIKHIDNLEEYAYYKRSYKWITFVTQTNNAILGNIDHFRNKISLKKESDLTNISKINKQCLKRTVKNWYLTNWRSELKESIKSKLYSSYKSKIEISPYLVHIHNRRYRNCLTKFRLSDHQLEIETGRHKKKDRNDRLCNICNGGYTENEIRFLLHCSAYQSIRNSFFKTITILKPKFKGFSDNKNGFPIGREIKIDHYSYE